MIPSTTHYAISDGLSLYLRKIITLMVYLVKRSKHPGMLELERLVEHMFNDGVYGLFILGTTGKRATPLKPTEDS